jgi:transposase
MARRCAAFRLLAIALVLDGHSRAEAAEKKGMDRQTLSDWVHRYNATGIDGLQSCHSPGATPLLSEAEKAELRALVVKGPYPEKDKIIRWRCLDLQAEIARQFSVRVHESTATFRAQFSLAIAEMSCAAGSTIRSGSARSRRRDRSVRGFADAGSVGTSAGAFRGRISFLDQGPGILWDLCVCLRHRGLSSTYRWAADTVAFELRLHDGRP